MFRLLAGTSSQQHPRQQQFVWRHSRRGIASYGVRPLTHSEVVAKYSPSSSAAAKCDTFAAFTERVLPQLDRLEGCLSQWRLGKWMFRVPVLLPQPEKEAMMERVKLLQTKFQQHVDTREKAMQDVRVIAGALGMHGATRTSIATLKREQVQEQIATLRWNGEVDTARAVRNAWERIEKTGANDAMLLERMCCVYGLLRNNCFDGAFGNVIRRDAVTGKIVLDESDPLREVAETIVANVPHIDLYYSFLGFDSEGYTGALGKYMITSLADKHEGKTNVASPAAPYTSGLLFALEDGSESLYAVGKGTVADFVHVARNTADSDGYTMTLVIRASENPYQRQVQLPQQRQLEAVARRLSFVMGVNPSTVRARTLFLPPTFMDRKSMERVHTMLGGVTKSHVHFHGQYIKDLEAEDADYAHQVSALPQEDWATL